MKFQYIGEKAEMKNVFGYDFSGHAVVDVPDSDTRTIGKLGANSHFKWVEPEPPKVPKKPKKGNKGAE